MDIVTAVKTCFSKYATFTGRATRSELWFFILFGWIVSIVMRILDMTFGTYVAPGLGGLSLVASVVLFIPAVAVETRRLHDIDRSAWWWLIALIPIIGFIVMIVWFCMEGTRGANRFGDNGNSN